MDIKKVEELVRMKNNCSVAIETLTIELLGTIANGVARLVAIEEDKLSGQMSLDLRKKPVTESKETFTQKVEEKVEEAIAKVEPVKKPAKKKAAPKPVEVKPEVVIEEASVPVAEKILPTKENVMKDLVAFIGANSEEDLAQIFKDLGNFTNFPSVPQEKYEELLIAINK